MKLRSNKRFYRIFNLSAELLSKFDSKITLKMIFVYSWKYDEYDIRAGIIAFKISENITWTCFGQRLIPFQRHIVCIYSHRICVPSL